MKNALIGAVVLFLALVVPVMAVDSYGQQGGPPPGPQGGPPAGGGGNIEERKVEILKRIDERIARVQQEKSCVQRAKTHEELRACREQFRPPDRPGRPGGMGGPGMQGR